MKLVTLALAFAFLTSAQDAIVVDLSPKDAAWIADLYKQRDEIEAKIEAARAAIGEKYATWEQHYRAVNPDGSQPPPDFEFSTDFKHIVPTPTRTLLHGGSGPPRFGIIDSYGNYRALPESDPKPTIKF